VKDLVIFTHRDTEYNRSYVFKTMNPLLALRPLTTDIEQSEQNNNKKIAFFHRRNQDFLWGCTFFSKKLSTFFSRLP